MGNSVSNNFSEGQSSTLFNIPGNFSGNSGSGNHLNSNNTTNTTNTTNATINHNYSGTSSPSKQTEILRCLYKSAYESHRRRVREPVEGTCTWVTEHPKYREWMAKEAAGLLWLSADPGCGKSVMASFLVGHLKAQTSAIVCYFFFKDDSEDQRSATFALCTILHQLFSQRRSLCIYAEAALEARGERFTEEVDTLWDILVKAVAEGGCGDVICVVDALDECDEVTLTPLVQYVNRLPGQQTSNTPLKFLVTSRPYHNIEKELGSRATTIRLRGEDEVGTITADVTRVIDNGIRELELIWENPGGLNYLRNLLVSAADRTFLWVSLVLEGLKDSQDGSAEEFTNIISTAPRDLAEFYTKILDKSPDPGEARRILQIVVAAARPLTTAEMNVVFRITRDHKSVRELSGAVCDGFEKTVKKFCGLFVRVIDSKIYLVHQTAREFLIKGSLPGKGNWQYTLCLKDSNFTVADICISYLSREEFMGSPLEIDILGCVSRNAVNEYLKEYAFLDYSVQHWADHLRDSQDKGIELFEFARLICEPGSRRCLAWFQIYWFNTWHEWIFLEDFTYLMIASFLRLGTVVDRLLEEEEGNINARSAVYGTALNIAALRSDKDMTRKLLQKNVNAYLWGKEYNILETKKTELEHLLNSLNSRSPELSEQDLSRLWNEAIVDLWLASCGRRSGRRRRCRSGRRGRRILISCVRDMLLIFSWIFAFRTHRIRTRCLTRLRPPRGQFTI